MALKISSFMPIAEFEERVSKLARGIKESPRAEGVQDILIPGEPEINERERRLKGGIPIAEKAWQPLVEACKQYGLDVEALMRT